MKIISRAQMHPRPDADLGPNPVNTGLRNDFGGAPVIFSASQANLTVGNIYNLNTRTLQPSFRTPYWIDEIRISMSCTYNLASPAFRFTGMSGFIEAKFQTGRFAFSRDFVPVGLYAPRWSRVDFGEAYGGNSGVTQRRRAFATVRWPLPKPLFMPAGDAVQCLLRFRSYSPIVTFGQTVESVTVAYAGRLAEPGNRGPNIWHVPWVAAYRKQGSVAHAQTNDEFRNPFSDRPWYVQRFTSRTFQQTDQGSGPPATADVLAETLQFQGNSTVESYSEVRLYDSLGYAIVPEYTPVNDVFDGTRGAWTFGRTLGPREQFDLQMRAAGGSLSTNQDYWTWVGVVGFREEG